MSQARRAAREKWRQIILSQRGSGQTVAAYCRARGIGQASFFAWKRRLGAAPGTREFVEVNAAADAVPGDMVGVDETAIGPKVRPGPLKCVFAAAVGCGCEGVWIGSC